MERAQGSEDLLMRTFRKSLLAAYRPQEVLEQVDRAGLLGMCVKQVSKIHMVIWRN
jgi:hypothetical protein